MKPRTSNTEEYLREMNEREQQEKIASHGHPLKDLDDDTTHMTKTTLQYMKGVTASFIGEMSWQTGISEYFLKPALRKMLDDGLLETVPVDYYFPDERLIARVPEMSAKGQAGYENFSRRRWFAITEKGREHLGSV